VLQLAERGIACPEIVDIQAYLHVFQAREKHRDRAGILHHGAFGNVETQPEPDIGDVARRWDQRLLCAADTGQESGRIRHHLVYRQRRRATLFPGNKVAGKKIGFFSRGHSVFCVSFLVKSPLIRNGN
jgi:hypothetical protein